MAMHSTIAFRSKTFRYPFWPSLIVLCNLAMGGVMFGVMLGLHPLLLTLLMFALVMLGIGIIGAHATYTLEAEGIRQHLEPFKWSLVKLPAVTRHFSWQDIRSYKVGSDMSRSMEQYNYLYISVRRFPWQLRLSDHQSSKEHLAAFTEAFEQYLQGIVPSAVAAGLPPTGEMVRADNEVVPAGDYAASGHRNTTTARPSAIRRKPDFYDTRLAHVFFWMLVLTFSILALTIVSTGNIKTSYLWRFNIVILPGMGYYAWRLYGHRSK